MKKQTYTKVLILTVLLIQLVACGKPESPLRVASHVWPGYEMMFLARSMGWLNETHVVLYETSSASESIKLLKEGEVDAAALTLDETLYVIAQGIPVTIVLVFDESAGADAVLVKPDINRLKDLKGKRIGIEKTAVGELMLAHVLDAAGISKNDVNIINVTIDKQEDEWKKERLDAVITYEPVISQLKKIGAKMAFDSREMPGVIMDVLVVRSDVVETQSSNISSVVKAHFRGLQHFHSFPQDSSYRMAKRLGVRGDEVGNLFAGLEVPSLEVNHWYLEKEGRLARSVDNVSEIMLKAEMLNKKSDYKNIITSKYLPAK